MTNNDGLLTRKLLKAPEVAWLPCEAGGVRQPGTVNILTVRVGVQAAVTLTTILKISLEGLSEIMRMRINELMFLKYYLEGNIWKFRNMSS